MLRKAMRVASLKCRFTAERVREIPTCRASSRSGTAGMRLCRPHPLEPLATALPERAPRAQRHGRDPRLALRLGNTSTPKGREDELLRQKTERQGRLPRYNLPGSPLCRPAARSPTCGHPGSSSALLFGGSAATCFSASPSHERSARPIALVGVHAHVTFVAPAVHFHRPRAGTLSAAACCSLPTGTGSRAGLRRTACDRAA
jgi:hypothetical protein